MRTTLILWAVLAAAPASAEFKVTLEASDKEIGLEDSVELTVQMVDQPAGATVEWPKSPDFEAVKLPASQPTSAGSSASVMVSFRPKRVGALTFPPVTVKTAQGKSLKTGSVAVNVIAGHVSTAKRASPKPPNVEFFMNAELEPSTSTLGDPLDLVLRVFIRKGPKDDPISVIDQIAFQLPENFVVDEMEVMPVTGETVIDDVPFRVLNLRRARVLPLTVGTFNATPSLQVIVGKGADAKPFTLTATLPVVVKPASDARRSFTPEEGQALLRKRPASLMQLARANSPTPPPPIVPMKRLEF